VLDAGSGFDNYIWSTSDSTQTITVDSAGTYFVTAANNSIGGLSCFASDTIVIGAADIAVNAGNDTSIIERDTVRLNAIVLGNSSEGTYSWTPIVDLSCTTCANPLAEPFETTTYQVVYTDTNGCIASDSITITVIPGEYYFYMPNAFSPNGDGENEIVFPIMKGVEQFTWRIWNRWGQKVFECVNSTVLCNWDGRVNGKLLDPSVFVWEAVVEFKKPSIERYKGSLTLVK
jgi:gliding motility-associated-like protein